MLKDFWAHLLKKIVFLVDEYYKISLVTLIVCIIVLKYSTVSILILNFNLKGKICRK